MVTLKSKILDQSEEFLIQTHLHQIQYLMLIKTLMRIIIAMITEPKEKGVYNP